MSQKRFLFASAILAAFLASERALSHGSSEPPQPSLAGVAREVCRPRLSAALEKSAALKWSGKTVLLDTNVVLNDPYSIFKFPGARVVIAGTVLEEVDNNKGNTKVGRAAREFMRNLDGIRLSGDIGRGVELGNGATLQTDLRDFTHLLDYTTMDARKKDNEIVAMALAYTYQEPIYGRVVLVSDDISVRIKASSEQIVAVPFEVEGVQPAPEVVPDIPEYALAADAYRDFRTNKTIPKPGGLNLAPNEFVILKREGESEGEALLARYFYDRVDPSKSGLRAVPDYQDIPSPPLNLEQRMLLDLALDPTIHLVFGEADAGTGKTFLTLQAGMLQLPKAGAPYSNRYQDITLTKPMVSMGRIELGTLPGDPRAKLSEKLSSYYDNLRQLMKKASNARGSGGKRKDQTVFGASEGEMRSRFMAVAPFSEVRGRSLHGTLMIGDEMQHSSAHEIKTLLTRVAEGSKIIIIGNAAQIDVPYLNERNNGLTVAISLFTSPDLSEAERSLVGIVRLREGVRSDLATLATKVFANPPPK